MNVKFDVNVNKLKKKGSRDAICSSRVITFTETFSEFSMGFS